MGVKLVPECDVTDVSGGSDGGGKGVVVWSEKVGGMDLGEEFEGIGKVVCACEVCEIVVEFENLLVGKGVS